VITDNEWTQHALAQAIPAFDYPDREGVWRAEIALVQEQRDWLLRYRCKRSLTKADLRRALNILASGVRAPKPTVH
jgi:hypothetical protein